MRKAFYIMALLTILLLISGVKAICCEDPGTKQCKCWASGYCCYVSDNTPCASVCDGSCYWSPNQCTGPFDFSISVSPSSGSVAQGGSVSTTVTATLTSGTSQSVSFSCSNLPSGASCSFNPTSCNPTCSSTLRISTSSTTPTGTYSITVIGQSGGLTRSTTYLLTVSPSTGSIAGSVKDTNNNPIAGASVSVSGPSSGSANTNSNGYYSISNLKPGSYSVTASAIGYNSQTKSASVTAGQTTFVDFVLTIFCDYDGICDLGETQVCSDCKTFVSIYPTYTYPGQEVVVTIYFYDSRFDVDKSDYDVKFDLFISGIPWNSTNGCDIGGKKFRADMSCGCGTGGCKDKHGYYSNSEYSVDFTDGYAKVVVTCKIPTTISFGTHTLKAVPVIYSSPTILVPGEITFKVANPLEKIFSELQVRIESFFRKAIGFFILR
jgi:hypothetical protein